MNKIYIIGGFLVIATIVFAVYSQRSTQPSIDVRTVFPVHISTPIEDVDILQGGGWKISDTDKHYWFTFTSTKSVKLVQSNGDVNFEEIWDGYIQYSEQVLKQKRSDSGFRCREHTKDKDSKVWFVPVGQTGKVEFLVFSPSFNSYCFEVYRWG
jgi:hypothetical protein